MSIRFNLDVWLDGAPFPAGTIAAEEGGNLTFAYATDYLEAGYPPLSLSLPLTQAPFADARARAFFENLLPENESRARTVAQYGLDTGDIAGILFHAGADCAGAISCLPEGSPPAKVPGILAEDYRPVSENELIQIAASLADFRRVPDDINDPSPVAGVQGKIALTRLADGLFALPIDGRHVPTTHILKVPPRKKGREAALEARSARLARTIGLDVVIPDAIRIGEVDALLIERFDRFVDEGTVYRIHQEDFAQSLGLAALLKYERRGTEDRKFDAAGIASLLDRTAAPALAREAFLKATFFNLAVGNNDNHAKNHALLYTGVAPRLAPLYDLLPTRLDHDVTDELAFRIGSATMLEEIDSDGCDAFLALFGLSGARAKRFRQTIAAMLAQLEQASAPLHEQGFKLFDDLIGRELATLNEALDLGLDLRARDYFETAGGGWLAS